MSVRVLLLPILMLGGYASVSAQQGGPFPHERHAGLFPMCEGCHNGMLSGVDSERFPEPETCARCHDGQREDPVDWLGPAPRRTNLDYSHSDHRAKVLDDGEPDDCASCHQDPDASGERMAVAPAAGERCLGCHAHEAEEHLAYERDCTACHVPVWRAESLLAVDLAEFPRPSDHEGADFVARHGERGEAYGAACATCHARQSCERCHLNGASVDAIAALEPDDRIARLVRNEPAEYPVPASHEASGWDWRHGRELDRSAGTCANCHTQPSCRGCHRDVVAAAIQALPMPLEDGPQGVEVRAEAARVHPADYATRHGIWAAADEATCAGCHAPATCESCHDGPASPGFHRPNFMEGHGPEAYGNEVDCASCHNPEVFCRGCHRGTGRTSKGRLDTAFHSARPFWLLGHGGAARQGLESCVTCHSQVDCAQCHSTLGGWGISPHGPGFDPSRAEGTNTSACALCHRGGRQSP